RLIHRFDRVFETRRGCSRAKMTVGIYDNCYTGWNGCPADAGDESGDVRPARADADDAGVSCHADVADHHVIVSMHDAITGHIAEGNVAGADSEREGVETDGDIIVAVVGSKSACTDRDVV